MLLRLRAERTMMEERCALCGRTRPHIDHNVPGAFNYHPFKEQRAPEPPTGPPAEKYTRADGRPEKYIAFLESEEGIIFWARIQDAALDAYPGRFSPRTYVAWYRDTHGVRINNDFSPWLADDLVAEHPKLLAIIERRKRKKAAIR